MVTVAYNCGDLDSVIGRKNVKWSGDNYSFVGKCVGDGGDVRGCDKGDFGGWQWWWGLVAVTVLWLLIVKIINDGGVNGDSGRYSGGCNGSDSCGVFNGVLLVFVEPFKYMLTHKYDN